MKQEVSGSQMIKINGADVKVEIPNGMTVGNFLEQISKHFSTQQEVISGFNINGKTVEESDEPAIKALPVEQIGMIEIFTSTPADLAYQTLDTLNVYIDRLIASIDRAALHYNEKNYIAGDSYFVKSIDGLDLFVQTIGGVKMALKIGLDQKIALAEAALVSTMNDLVEAKRTNNYVFLAELLKKDLVECMVEWRDEIFPIIRNWKVS